MNLNRSFLWLALAWMVIQSPRVMACATCYGQTDSKLAEGMNWGILTLMIIVYGVLLGIAGFFDYIIYRSNRLAAAQAAAQENDKATPSD